MKNKFASATIFLFSLLIMSCGSDDTAIENTTPIVASALDFKALQEKALENVTQHFELTAGSGMVNLTSEKGVIIQISSNNFSLNGTSVIGTIDIKFIEIFDTATMAATNRATVGRAANGSLSMLLSGGEFYINATKDNQQLDFNATFRLIIPAGLTGEVNNNMTLWKGAELDTIGINNNMVWDELNVEGQEQDQWNNIVFVNNESYYAFFSTFGWTNVDCFYNSTEPKTKILAKVPDGYNFENSTVYLSYDGKGNALAQLDVFTPEGYFSEHYGLIPIGLQCHAIFMTEDDGLYKYSIKAVTISVGGIITFDSSEVQTGTEAEFIAAVQAVQS